VVASSAGTWRASRAASRPANMPLPIILLPATSTVVMPVVLAVSDGPLVACDFYIDDIERGEEVPGGYQLGRVLNVDHHAPTPRMTRQISSANLALERLAAVGAPPADARVVVNHTDCDSVLSAGLMAGRLEPAPELGAAAIAADHTGAEHPLADLLQALDPRRDVELSLRNAALLLAGRPVEREAAEALAERARRRERARQSVTRGEIARVGPVAFGSFDGEVDGEFFPALLPDAVVILLAYPRPDAPGRWIMKIRLGAAAPPGLTLHALGVARLDPIFGGRWNAGSNRRSGGTHLSPAWYVRQLKLRMSRLTDASNEG